MFEDAQDRLSELTSQTISYSKEHPWIAAGVGVGVLVTSHLLFKPKSKDDFKNKPSTAALTGGGIARAKVRDVYTDYHDAYGKDAGEGIKDRSRTTGKDWAASEASHESRLPALLGLHAGKKGLDVGCGVGGPMRTIASTSGAEVTGITINDYQVKRAKYHNKKYGVEELCKPTQGDFLNMPFKDNTFDGAYAIEATCHAAVLKEVYAEILRVLKPGAKFASYEWVSTKHYDPKNKQHVQIIDDINYGNGLPEMRTYKEAEQAGLDAGFKLVKSYDVASESVVAGPWYSKLAWLRKSNIISFNRLLVRIFTILRIAPSGMQDVHDMLVKVAQSLCAGGETGIFTPMHLLVFEKPTEAPASDGQEVAKKDAKSSKK